MIRRILAYILFGLGFLTVTSFRNYSGTVIPHEFIFWLIGLVFGLTGLALLRWTPTIKEQNSQAKIKKMIKELKENGEKIKVELSLCEIKSNDYSEEQLVSGNAYDSYTSTTTERINILTGNEIENVKKVDIYQSVLIFKHNFMSRTETFISKVVPNEHTSLLFKLDKQKKTFIYVDRQDRTKYYFDLEFLSV